MNVSRLLFAVVAVASLLTSGCGGSTHEDQSQTGPSHGDVATSNPQAAPENSTSMNPTRERSRDMPTAEPPAAAPHTYRVELTEYHIQFPTPLPTGEQALNIINSGKDTHGLVIVVNGVGQVLANDLKRGDTVMATINLKPGTYTVYCPEDGHKGKGMTTSVVVQ
jgi:hypothetical protein